MQGEGGFPGAAFRVADCNRSHRPLLVQRVHTLNAVCLRTLLLSAGYNPVLNRRRHLVIEGAERSAGLRRRSQTPISYRE